MKIKSKNNRWFILLLSSSALLIWIIIVFQFFSAVKQDSDINTVRQNIFKSLKPVQVPEGYSDSLFAREISVRNPFEIKKIEKKVPKPPPPKPKVVPRLSIPINYVGFIRNHKDNLALLDLGNGQTVIKKPGDHVEGIMIRQISRKEITVTENGNSFVLPILK
jgi:type II secretory pathway component PulC